MNTEETRERLRMLLTERGVWTGDEVVAEIPDPSLSAALAAIDRYDAEGADRPDWLVGRLRPEKLAGYRHPSERTRVDAAPTGSGEITPKLIASVRAGCSTPDGITREEARGLYAAAASARGVAVDVLIDAAKGGDWQETPPHPGKDPENENQREDYLSWVAGRPVLKRMP